MICDVQNLPKSYRRGWAKFRIAEALGPGEHEVYVASPGPPVVLDVYGLDYDQRGRPTAVIEAYHPDIDGISWEAIWNEVRRQFPINTPQRPATDAEYQTLKESIAKFGSLQRVIVDEAGNVIAGRLRKRACEELCVHCPTEVISGLNEDQKEQLSFELDFCRRQLSLGDKRKTAEFLIKANPRNSNRKIGLTSGLDHKTVGGIRDELEVAGEIPQVEQRQGSDGKTYKFPKIAANSPKEENRAKTVLETLGSDAPLRPIDLKRGENLVRLKKADEWRANRANHPVLPDDSIRIVLSDFRNLQIENDSVPLIMTDPPYVQDGMHLWKELATFAKRVLRPDGYLVTYAGTHFLPEIMAALTSELKFVWQVALIHNGGQTVMWSRNIVNKYKPILIFSKGEPRCPIQIQDVFFGAGKEKEFHVWQQHAEEFMHFIDKFSNPGDLVVDPFGGGFTTAAACHRLGRPCLTCDIDPDCVQSGLERLAQERQSSNK